MQNIIKVNGGKLKGKYLRFRLATKRGILANSIDWRTYYRLPHGSSIESVDYFELPEDVKIHVTIEDMIGGNIHSVEDEAKSFTYMTTLGNIGAIPKYVVMRVLEMG